MVPIFINNFGQILGKVFRLGKAILVKVNLGNMPILGKVILCKLYWARPNWVWSDWARQDHASPDWAMMYYSSQN